ncbi:MBL fold metallo-hydrolase [Mycolicibacterium sp. 050232]|uniref:MBL fold metallo-hydrolase n=1 Tax=Mycolicibacterium sp. 050232 TaxID=3113982 RepID=UPI002E2875C3|nr:MBL fold metallo-hydrolase [Mycolicibacterium sp. 050232]MED5814591.1 MBL fold metallo-hydrolase [Mycolicibacterium sp. 050232]
MTGVRDDHADAVAQPGFVTCCRALGGLPVGVVRPRRKDQRLLASLADRGLPAFGTTVEVITLPQRARMVPTPAIAEGVWRPLRTVNAVNAFVIRHPMATFLVDPGVCVDVVGRAVAELPWLLRVAVTPPRDVVDIRQALALAGIDVADIDFALPTHLHWDHVAGLLDLPGLPAYLHRLEHSWAMSGPVAPQGGVRSAVRDRPVTLYDLDGPPILTFPCSHDLFGDRSVVLVGLPGHTPGSIGILVQTSTGPTLLAGDAVWSRIQIDRLRQKASYPGLLADADRDAAWATLHRLHAIRDRLAIVPSHDHDGQR